MKQTTAYNMFKFRSDNRAAINHNHVAVLAESMKTKDLLEFRPILVNEDMEILDGQHRLLAAQSLQIPVHYEIKKEGDVVDVLLLNKSKAWTLADYLNFWCRQGNKNYIKFQQYMKEHGLSLSVVLDLHGRSPTSTKHFRDGKFIYKDDILGEKATRCRTVIDLIATIQGKKSFLVSIRFWRALISFTQKKEVDIELLKQKIEQQISRVGPRATESDYYLMLMDVYNWKNRMPVDAAKK